MNREKTKFIVINDVQYRPNYRLWLSFNDGKKQVVDFEPFLKKSHHPEIQKYLDHKLFEQFTFEDGYVYWNDYDLFFHRRYVRRKNNLRHEIIMKSSDKMSWKSI